MTIKVGRFKGVLVWVIAAGIVLVALAITVVNLLDRSAIEQNAAQNVHTAFSRAAASVSRIISKSGGIHDTVALQEAFQDIFELRPGIRRLSVYEVSSGSGSLILSSDPSTVPAELTRHELMEIAAGRSLTQFEDYPEDRAWVITAPILLNGQVVGALRGRFSLWRYDRLIKIEGQVAKEVLVGAVFTTCLVFFVLIRLMVHQPIHQLLQAMRRAEAGDLTGHALPTGPVEIQEVAIQFNRMLDRVREAIAVKEALLGEIQGFNDTLRRRVTETKEELHRANLMLIEARIQTERAEKLAALGELSAVVAHELGNPLNSISGHLQLLLKEADQKERHRHLTIIRSEIDRMVTIIQHILESTRQHVQSAPVDLNEVIRGIEGLIAPSLSGKRIVFKTELAAQQPSVAGDQRALHGMIFNLVTNAIQAMPDGGELTVKTLHAIDDRVEGMLVLRGDAALKKGAVRLILCDTGRGIPSDHLAKIFEPFFTTRHNGGGTGLGLAICHRVVSSIGGRMAVHSVFGHGTCFTIDLPKWNESQGGDPHHES
jgi:two-component system, NtrC family, sensor kinase